MKLLYVSQFYPPENIAGAFRAHDNANNWASSGDEVFMYTAYPNYPIGKIFDGYSNELFSIEEDDNLKILRNKILIKPNTSFFNRVISGCSFYFSGRKNFRKVQGSGIELVFASSGPIFAGYLGQYVAKKLDTPFVIEFRDITFEQMVAAGASRASWEVRLMKALELRLCEKANHVVVLTNGFKTLLECSGISAEKISVIPNGSDIISTNHNTHESLTLGYFGTMGVSQDVCKALEFALSVKRFVPGLRCTLVGEGAARSDVENWMKAHQEQNFSLEHGMSLAALEKYYCETDFCIVSLQDSPALSGTIPSKIFQSLARGVPVLFIGPEGEAAELIRQSGTGLVLTENDEKNVDSLKKFFTSDDWNLKLQGMRKNAVSLMQQQYSRTTLASKLRKVLTNVKREGRDIKQ